MDIGDMFFQHWQEILFGLIFVWLVVLSLAVRKGNVLSRRDHQLLKDELGKDSQALKDSVTALERSCQEELSGLMKYGDGLEERIAVLEDRDLESTAEYSGLLSEVTAIVQRGGDSSKHAFYLRVADEIVKIQNNLNHMGPEVKGYKQLLKCNERLKDAMHADGYEFVDLLDRPYVGGMKHLIFLGGREPPRGIGMLSHEMEDIQRMPGSPLPLLPRLGLPSERLHQRQVVVVGAGVVFAVRHGRHLVGIHIRAQREVVHGHIGLHGPLVVPHRDEEACPLENDGEGRFL